MYPGINRSSIFVWRSNNSLARHRAGRSGSPHGQVRTFSRARSGKGYAHPVRVVMPMFPRVIFARQLLRAGRERMHSREIRNRIFLSFRPIAYRNRTENIRKTSVKRDRATIVIYSLLTDDHDGRYQNRVGKIWFLKWH